MLPILYQQAMELITLPYPKFKITGTASNDYFIRLFLSECDWIINIDEDCFVIDNEEIQSLLDYMIEEDYDFCGIPDGGVVSIRSASPVVMNAFFNIFNITKIRNNLDIPALIQSKFGEDLLEKTPVHLLRGPYSYITLERYYHVFYWLVRHFRPLWLDALTMKDGITTELLSHRGKPLCWHTWYGREYLNNPEQRERIDRVITEARAR
jgi:hypothetical protein